MNDKSYRDLDEIWDSDEVFHHGPYEEQAADDRPPRPLSPLALTLFRNLLNGTDEDLEDLGWVFGELADWEPDSPHLFKPLSLCQEWMPEQFNNMGVPELKAALIKARNDLKANPPPPAPR